MLSFRDAPLGAGPESILTMVVMDSLMCNCTSKLATSSRPGMTWRGKLSASASFRLALRAAEHPLQVVEAFGNPRPVAGERALCAIAGLDARPRVVGRRRLLLERVRHRHRDPCRLALQRDLL